MNIDSKDNGILGSRMSQFQAFEDLILTGENKNTTRGLNKYAFEFGFPNRESLIHFIDNKSVVDMGSGYDIFALDCNLSGLNTHVISVNPTRNDPTFISNRLQEAKKIFTSNNMEEIINGILAIDDHGIATFAHELSRIPNNSVDIIFDCFASFYYSEKQYEDINRKSVQELLRILKPGGNIFIGGAFVKDIDGSLPWYFQYFRESNIPYQTVNEFHNQPEKTMPGNIVVTKPEA